MKICVVGAGSVGGLIAARIARARANKAIEPVSLSVLARGETLKALQQTGLTLYEPVAGRPGEFASQTWPVPAADDAHALGTQDLIVIAVKYNALAALAPQLRPLIGPDTTILSAMNGVPWWFTCGLDGEGATLSLPAVDPEGRISAALPPDRVLGCVVHLAASRRGPAQIQVDLGNRLVIGEPMHHRSARLARVGALLTGAGFDIEQVDDIHRVVWFKLWGNMTMNPVSAITGAMSDTILADPQLRGFLSAVMREAARVGARIGLPITDEPESRHAVTESLGGFRTSMLQDALAGRSLEIDALVTIVREIAGQLDEDVPFTDALLGLIRVFAKTHQLD